MIDPTSPGLNYVVIGAFQSPGLSKISGAGMVYKWDVQVAYGNTGAVLVYRGRDLSRFTWTITLWRREHFIAWEAFKKLLEPPKPFVKLVVEMSHPILADVDIKAVAIENRGAFERQPNGLFTANISVIQYKPPIPALVKPRGAVPSASKGIPTAPQTEADRALVAATANFEAARTAAQ